MLSSPFLWLWYCMVWKQLHVFEIIVAFISHSYKTLEETKTTSSLIYNTSASHERHDCDMSATWVRHKCGTSITQTTRVQHEWKILILIATRLKTYFHTPILAMYQIKDYKERKIVVLRTTFWKCLVPIPKCAWKVHHKKWTL